VNPSGFFALTVPSFAGSSVSYSIRQEEVYLRPRALTSLFLIGPVTTFATQEGIPLSRAPPSSLKRLLKVPSDEQPTAKRCGLSENPSARSAQKGYFCALR
jgi:hypothetical protein